MFLLASLPPVCALLENAMLPGLGLSKAVGQIIL